MSSNTMKKLHLWVTRAQRTELAPELLDQMAKIDDLNNYARLLIERIRRVAQPNKNHRTVDPQRMVPQDDKTNERLQLVKALQEGIGGCMSDNQTVVNFFKVAAEAEVDMNRHQDRYLRQAQIYAVNELKKFTEGTYAEIRQAFDELNKRRTAYDFARDRLRFCPNNEIDQRGHDAMGKQKDFERQAFLLFELLQRIPEYQMKVAKALHNFIRAEAEFCRVSYSTLKAIKDPERYSAEYKGGIYSRLVPSTVKIIKPDPTPPPAPSSSSKSPTGSTPKNTAAPAPQANPQPNASAISSPSITVKLGNSNPKSK